MPLLPQPPAFIPPVIAVPAANGIVPFVAPAAAAVAGSAGLVAGAPIAAAAAAGLGAGLIAGAIAGQLWGVPNNDRDPGTEPPEDSSAGLSGSYSPSGWTIVTATATRVTIWIEDQTAPDGRTLVDVTPSGAAAVNTVALLGPLSFAPNGRPDLFGVPFPLVLDSRGAGCALPWSSYSGAATLGPYEGTWSFVTGESDALPAGGLVIPSEPAPPVPEPEPLVEPLVVPTLPKAPPVAPPSPVNPAAVPVPEALPVPGRPATVPAAPPATLPFVPGQPKPAGVPVSTAGTVTPQLPPGPTVTPTGTHFPGGVPIPSNPPQATPQGIAEELGRIEKKLAKVLSPEGTALGDLLDKIEKYGDEVMRIWELLTSITGGGSYELSSPCVLDENDERIVEAIPYDGALGSIGVLSNKIDALAGLMQVHKDLKQPICRQTPAVGQPVQVQFVQIE